MRWQRVAAERVGLHQTGNGGGNAGGSSVTITNDWGRATADLTVTNNTRPPSPGKHHHGGGPPITNLWNGTFTQTGSAVT